MTLLMILCIPSAIALVFIAGIVNRDTYIGASKWHD
jgi:hypothetical protein